MNKNMAVLITALLRNLAECRADVFGFLARVGEDERFFISYTIVYVFVTGINEILLFRGVLGVFFFLQRCLFNRSFKETVLLGKITLVIAIPNAGLIEERGGTDPIGLTLAIVMRAEQIA